MPDGEIAVAGDLFAPVDVDAFCSSHAEAIRLLGRRVVADIIEIGQRLIAVRERLAHGQWLPWLDREFGWSERTARNFIAAAESFGKSATVADLPIDAGALYLLAAPSVPEAARGQAIAAAEAGNRITKAEAERLIAEARAAERAGLEDQIASLQAEVTRLQTFDDEASKDLARRVAHELGTLELERDEARAALAETRRRERDIALRDRRSLRALAALRQLHSELQAINASDVAGTDEEFLIACQQAVDIGDWLNRFRARCQPTPAVASS